MVSGPGVRSGQGAITPLLDVDIGLTFAEETNRYVPSNGAPAVEDDVVCASAAASKPKKPTIDSSPICFRMSLPASLGFRKYCLIWWLPRASERGGHSVQDRHVQCDEIAAPCGLNFKSL